MLLRHIPFFTGLDAEQSEALMGISRNLAYRSGEAILEEGQPGPGLYVIQAGEVTIQKKRPEGGAEVLASLLPGEFFGEVSLVTELPTTADAVASEDTSMLFLPRDELLSLISSWPDLELRMLRQFVRTLCRRLHEADELLVTLRRWESLRPRLLPGS